MEDALVRSVVLKRDGIGDLGAYPFSIPAIRQLDQLGLDPHVTLFAGENGSGKSTLVEAIAVVEERARQLDDLGVFITGLDDARVREDVDGRPRIAEQDRRVRGDDELRAVGDEVVHASYEREVPTQR